MEKEWSEGTKRPSVFQSKADRVAIPAACNRNVRPLSGLHVDVRVATALVALGGDDLVVVIAQVETSVAPCIELQLLAKPQKKPGTRRQKTYVILHVDGTTNALGSADRPVLLEGGSTVDRRLVGAG